MSDISHEPWDLHTLITNYNKGFKGSIYDPVHYAKFMSELPMPYFGEAAPHLAGSGKGKLSTPFRSVLHFDPNAYEERQVTGDCFLENSLVLLANGQHKPISEVKIGEEVITHNNKRRKVLNVIKKPYSGKILKLKVNGRHDFIECTPDHRFITIQNFGTMVWNKAENLTLETDLLAPYGIDEDYVQGTISFDILSFVNDDPKVQDLGNGLLRYKHSRYKTKRYVELDEDLAWVIGMYLAEGGIDATDAYRIEWSLERHVEQEYADRICRIMEAKFGGKCYQNNLPSKSTVTMVRYGNKLVGKFIKKLIPGNVYNKELPEVFLYQPKNIRLALLRGWVDGDGHFGLHEDQKNNRTTLNISACTASRQLRDTMSVLARSLGIKSTQRIAPREEHQTSDSFKLAISTKSAFKLFPEKEQEVLSQLAVKELDEDEFNNLGQKVRLKSIEEYQVENIFVYCLEVEEEHTFVVSPLAVSNCVSHATRNAVDVTRCVQAHLGIRPEGWVARGATEAIYGSRGHGGQGMSCSGAADFVHRKGGIVLRQKFASADLTKYTGMTGAGWGGRGVPSDIVEIGKQHQIRTVSQIRTVEEARDALANGYGIAVCSNFGFSSVRDSKGYARPQGNWSHGMAWTANCDISGQESFMIQNSWAAWNSGGQPEWGPIPIGAFLITYEVAQRMLSQGGAFAYSDAVGYPAQKLPDYGTSSFL